MTTSTILPPWLARWCWELAVVLVVAGILAISAVRARGAEGNSVSPKTYSIMVDQVGYPVDGPKVAVVTAPATQFEVRRANDDVAVFHGSLTAAAFDSNSGDEVRAADFSGLRQPGTYYLQVSGLGRSWNFTIGPSPFDRVYYLAMRAFYGQRCGTAVDLGREFPGYSHAACHQQGEFHASAGKSGPHDNVGGWHDAGDYGRYMVNSGVTTGTLLWAWELFGQKLQHIQLNIPESGNGTPDFLSEVRWNLEWMLKMQDADGGAWHKQTSEHFPDFIMPEKDTLPSEVIGTGSAPYKSTCATADLAAVGAIAARAYRPFDAKFADRALEAAKRAWVWTERYPDVTFKNPSGVTTGEYGDAVCADERLWAAVELWRTTGDSAYHDHFLTHYAEFLSSLDAPPVENWKEVGGLALRAYVLMPRKGSNALALKAIRERVLTAADSVAARTQCSPYHVSLQTRDYVWGSNSIAAQYGVDLLMANALVPHREYVDAARDNLHYLLGRNTFSLSWVTQVGNHPLRHPHHRPSGAGKTAEPWPGLLSGGPNANRQDPVLSALPANLPPAKVYVDDVGSYGSNEVAINWQALLVFLLAGQLQ